MFHKELGLSVDTHMQAFHYHCNTLLERCASQCAPSTEGGPAETTLVRPCRDRAWFEDAERGTFDWPQMRGEVVASSEAQVLGAFYGQRFSAEVFRPDSSEAHAVEFLVTEAMLRQSAGPVAEA